MGDGYTTMYDILKNSLVERRERYGTTAISHIVIDGNKFGGYKTFSSFWEKTYAKQPERSASGVIGNLNSIPTFVTFHLKIDFAMMSIDDYRRLYNLMLSRNEFTVTAYNVLDNSTHTCKMYFAPDQMPKLYAVARKLQGQGDKYIEVLGVQDYTIELIGTNNSLETVDILYHDKDGVLIPEATQTVNLGDEVVVNYNYIAPSGYRFDGVWEKRQGQTVVGTINNGSVMIANLIDNETRSINLYAKVSGTNNYVLTLDYGFGKKPIPYSSSDNIDKFDITKGTSIKTAIDGEDISLSNGTQLTFDVLLKGTGSSPVTYNGLQYENVFEFKGWYSTPIEDDVTRLSLTSIYGYEFNKTIYQIYKPKKFTVTYVPNKSGVSLSPVEVEYGGAVPTPIFNVGGQTIKGWYKDIKLTQEFNGTMPPTNITLFAKWE